MVAVQGGGEALLVQLPPWNLETHVGDLVETATVHAVEHTTWIGFSLGGRLVAELALREPGLVDRLVLLEPVLQLPPEDGLAAAERERHEETYASAEEAVAVLAAAIGFSTPRAYLVEEAAQHLTEAGDGRLRFRYSESAAVAAWGEMARARAARPSALALPSDGDAKELPFSGDAS